MPPVVDSGRMRILVAEDVTDPDAALALVVREGERLVATAEEELPTTILALPNFLPDDFLAWNSFIETLEDALDLGGGLEALGDEVLVAAFHPLFQFGGLEPEEAVLDYEKRAPLPVINLLRTEAIDRGISKGVTAETIAAANERSLLAEGIQSVKKHFEKLSG